MIIRIMFLTIVVFTMTSCSRTTQKDTEATYPDDSSEIINENIPIAFEENGIDNAIESYSRLGKLGNNPIDILFKDYLDTDEQLESEIESFMSLFKEGEEIDSQISEFINNNDNYYLAIESLLNSIKKNDSLVYNLMLSKINKSKLQYSKQAESYQQLSKSESDIFKSWNTYLNAVKILKTLEMVEKYQRVESIQEDAYNELLDKQKSLTNKMQNRLN